MTRKTLSTDLMNSWLSQVLSSVERFNKAKVLVIGDSGIDEYIHGKAHRISQEAPVPIVNVENVEMRLGLAANVAHNIHCLGGKVELISLTGSDESSKELAELLLKAGMSDIRLVEDSTRDTTKKTRIIQGTHHILRVDYESKSYITEEIESQVKKAFLKSVDSAQVVILEDYNKGLLTESLCQFLINECKKRSLPILVDPHLTTPSHFYKGATLMTPNREETYALLGLVRDGIIDNIDIKELGESLWKSLNTGSMVLTLGPDGLVLFEGEDWVELPTEATEVFDVAGAGDTVVAAMALGLATGLELGPSCYMGNKAAGVVVAKMGCAPCHKEELVSVLNESKN